MVPGYTLSLPNLATEGEKQAGNILYMFFFFFPKDGGIKWEFSTSCVEVYFVRGEQ